MRNMDSIINSHNRKILNSDKRDNDKRCNCREENKPNCPIPKKCATKCIVYKATVVGNNANYIGMASTSFKDRYRNHLQSFSKKEKENATSLAKYVWDNGLNPNPRIKWEIVKECRVYQPGNKACDLCITEKVEILKQVNNPLNINKRNDLGTRCVHRKSHTLGAIT